MSKINADLLEKVKQLEALVEKVHETNKYLFEENQRIKNCNSVAFDFFEKYWNNTIIQDQITCLRPLFINARNLQQTVLEIITDNDLDISSIKNLVEWFGISFNDFLSLTLIDCIQYISNFFKTNSDSLLNQSIENVEQNRIKLLTMEFIREIEPYYNKIMNNNFSQVDGDLLIKLNLEKYKALNALSLIEIYVITGLNNYPFDNEEFSEYTKSNLTELHFTLKKTLHIKSTVIV